MTLRPVHKINCKLLSYDKNKNSADKNLQETASLRAECGNFSRSLVLFKTTFAYFSMVIEISSIMKNPYNYLLARELLLLINVYLENAKNNTSTLFFEL